jgi:short-subunit dehydrogenase
MRRTALVTGATAGIGAGFAHRLAADSYDLVLVARDADRLRRQAIEIADRYGVGAEALPADLTADDGCAAVAARLADPLRPIDFLVNNAGISINRPFLASTIDEQERLLRLNVRAVLHLTHAALPGMVERGQGAVINVSSVAGWAVRAGSTYPASKAWVTSFSESVAASVRPFGVRVLALCPGYTRTEFHDRAAIEMSALPRWLWLDVDQVVREGMRDLRRGATVSVPSWRYKIAVLGARHLPRGLVGRTAGSPRPRSDE